MLDSNIRGLFKKIEYQIANLKAMFSKNEKQLLDNLNAFKDENEKFKEYENYKLDKHLLDGQNPHEVTKEQVGLGLVDNIKQASFIDFENHVNAKSNPHNVTKSQIELGNVDNIRQASKADFDNHVTSKTSHTSEIEKSKWNNGQLYKLTQDSGDRLPLPKELNGTDVLSLPAGHYYAAGQYLTNMPTTDDSGWFNIDIFTAVTRKDIHVCRSFDNSHWVGTVHTEGNFIGWERMVTSSNLDVVWNKPTLQSGWKQYVPSDGAINTVRFSKDLVGVVEIKGAVQDGTMGLDTPVFTLPEGYRPIQSEYFIGVASSVGTPGVPQYHRTFIGTDGRVCIEYSSNTTNPNRFLAFGFQFRIK